MSTGVVMSAPVVTTSPSDLFFEQLSRAPRRVLLLDYDGTIAPFSAYRNRAFPYPTIPELLDLIMSTCRTRVLLISGRTAREIPPLLGLCPHPEIWGSYGLERLQANGQYSVAHVSADVQHALAQASLWLEQEGLEGSVELKPGAIAVHWRGLNPGQVEEARAAAYRGLSQFVGADLMLAEFDGGLELRLRNCNKGDVVRAVLTEHGPHTPVAYLGDDSTDEDAFRALTGRGLTVLVRRTCRFTAAQSWLRPPEELVGFLSDWVRACGGDI